MRITRSWMALRFVCSLWGLGACHRIVQSELGTGCRYYWGNSPPIGDASPCGSSGINSAQITHPLKAKFQNGLVCYNDDPMAMSDADNKSAPQLTQRVECARLLCSALTPPLPLPNPLLCP